MLSHLVRRQLRELRIDPDTIITARHWPPRWLRVSRFVHKDALLISLGSAAALLLIIVIAILVTASVSPPQSGAQTGSQIGSTVVSFGDTAVPLSTPSYRRISKGTTVVDVRLKLGNQGSGRAVLLAGDVLLVDSGQAIFPMSWQATDGTWHDGLAEPDPALIDV